MFEEYSIYFSKKKLAEYEAKNAEYKAKNDDDEKKIIWLKNLPSHEREAFYKYMISEEKYPIHKEAKLADYEKFIYEITFKELEEAFQEYSLSAQASVVKHDLRKGKGSFVKIPVDSGVEALDVFIIVRDLENDTVAIAYKNLDKGDYVPISLSDKAKLLTDTASWLLEKQALVNKEGGE